MKLFQFLVGCSLLCLGACVTPKNLEFKGVESLKIEKASFGKNVFVSTFSYYNPNHFNLVLKKLDCSIYLNDQFFTQYTLDASYPITANANFSLPATMEIDLSQLLKNSVDLLLNKPFKISIKGNATISKGWITRTVPVAFETNQKLNLKEALLK